MTTRRRLPTAMPGVPAVAEVKQAAGPGLGSPGWAAGRRTFFFHSKSKNKEEKHGQAGRNEECSFLVAHHGAYDMYMLVYNYAKPSRLLIHPRVSRTTLSLTMREERPPSSPTILSSAWYRSLASPWLCSLAPLSRIRWYSQPVDHNHALNLVNLALDAAVKNERND